jgi:hypothetical protein
MAIVLVHPILAMEVVVFIFVFLSIGSEVRTRKSPTSPALSSYAVFAVQMQERQESEE